MSSIFQDNSSKQIALRCLVSAYRDQIKHIESSSNLLIMQKIFESLQRNIIKIWEIHLKEILKVLRLNYVGKMLFLFF